MIFLKESHDGHAILENTVFKRLIRELHRACPWATAFQSWEFISVWYNCYKEQFDPVLIFEKSDDGQMSGFLALAQSRTGERLVVAGDHQAEYQCWLAQPGRSDAFISAALETLRGRRAIDRIVFKYLPPNAPVGWARKSNLWRHGIRFRSHARPLIDLSDGEGPAQSLRKKSTKSRINRLKRLGDLRFRELKSGKDLGEVIDQIATQYDIRQGAMNDVCPFSEDPHKRDFHLELMRFPRLLHASTLMLGDAVVASHIGSYNRQSLSLGVFSYSPVLAKHSPGKIFLLMLGDRLAKQGMSCFDLTPGGEWKDRFATKHDVVEEMTVFLDRAALRGYELKERVLALAKCVLALIGVTPAQARAAVARLSRAKPSSFLRILRANFWRNREFRVYYCDSASARRLEPIPIFARDKTSDLLAFEPSEPWQSRQAFLADALRRLEEGHHVYTLVENGRLVHYGWLIEHQDEAFFTEVEQSFKFPPGTAVIFDFFTHPAARGRGLYQAAMRQMLLDAARLPSVERISVSVLADNGPSRHAIEKIGFRHAASLYNQRRFLMTRRWRDPSSEGARPK